MTATNSHLERLGLTTEARRAADVLVKQGHSYADDAVAAAEMLRDYETAGKVNASNAIVILNRIHRALSEQTHTLTDRFASIASDASRIYDCPRYPQWTAQKDCPECGNDSFILTEQRSVEITADGSIPRAGDTVQTEEEAIECDECWAIIAEGKAATGAVEAPPETPAD